MAMPMNREALCAFPPPNRALTSFEIGRDLLPGVEVFGGRELCWFSRWTRIHRDTLDGAFSELACLALYSAGRLMCREPTPVISPL